MSRPGDAADPERSLFESKRRAKSKVRDIALCNRFSHMFTWTLDPELIDRYDAKAIYKKVRVFLTNATQRKGFRYDCIPEYHALKAGEERPAIHMHGLCILGDVQTTPARTPSGQPICDDMQRAYDEHVGNMQAKYGTTNINSAGLSNLAITGWSNYKVSSNGTIVSTRSDVVGCKYFSTTTGIAYSPALLPSGNQNYSQIDSYLHSATFSVPVAGSYNLLIPSFAFQMGSLYGWKGSPTAGWGYLYYCHISYSSDGGETWRSLKGNGASNSESISSPFQISGISMDPLFLYRVDFFIMSGTGSDSKICEFSANDYFYLLGVRAFPSGSNIVSTDTRVGPFSGNFGYYGDNGQMITAENVKIVDETNNTYYNPTTGQTAPIKDWTYDYSDRSYHLTLDGGTTTTVTYGDENVTIKEGDTTYNVYYIVQGSGGGEVDPTPTPTPTPSPSPTPCPHDYTGTVTEEPTCIAPGVKTYVCSLCGNTYPEKIPATGHKWEVKETVHTQYDKDGNVIQTGYTIWKCSVCSEEYKDTEGTGPPNGGGSDSGERPQKKLCKRE